MSFVFQPDSLHVGKKRFFGKDWHFEIGGRCGSGKSTILNFPSTQLVHLGVPVIILDTTGQVSRILLNHLQDAYFLDFQSYRRNFLVGPRGISQWDWIRGSIDHLSEGLSLNLMTINAMMELSQRIIRDGQKVTIPRLLERLGQPSNNSSSCRALRDRLVSLQIKTGEVFTCDRGFDLSKLFKKSVVIDLNGISEELAPVNIRKQRRRFKRPNSGN